MVAGILLMNKSFGEVLRELRQNRKFSQRQLAIKYGVLQGKEYGATTSLVAAWESNSRNPTKETVNLIAQAIQATDIEHDALLIAAGYLPTHGTTGIYDTGCVSIPNNTAGAVEVALRVTQDIPEQGKRQVLDFVECVKAHYENRPHEPLTAGDIIACLHPEFTKEMQDAIKPKARE